MIKLYCEGRGVALPDMHYFLTSRRACAVPALENDEDIKELIGQKYQGTFSNLLTERFGLSLHDGDTDKDFDYDTKPEEIMTALEPYKTEIFAKAKEEKALAKKRARTLKILQANAKEADKDRKKLERFKARYEKKKAREDARAAKKAAPDEAAFESGVTGE